MITDSASAIQNELDQLIDLQIAMLGQESPLTSDQLFECHLRFEKIQLLYRELDRINRAKVAVEFADAC
jgi:hypothetical protein